LYQPIMLINLALIAIDPPIEHFFECDVASQRRGLKHCEGAGQVAQPFFAAGLGIIPTRDRLEPVELLDGVGVAQAEREEARAVIIAQGALELILERYPLTVL